MKKFRKNLWVALTVLAVLISSMSTVAFAAEDAKAGEPAVIKHTFGGENGEWELDTDNSQGVWSYYTSYGNVDTIQNTVLSLIEDQNTRTTGEAYYAMNKNGFLHPGASDPWSTPVVALTMEETGTLKAVMTAVKESSEGNGVVAKFYKNNEAGILNELALTTAGEHTMEAEVAVEKGDVIYFLIHHNNEVSYDGAVYVLDYTLTVAAEPEQPDRVEGEIVNNVTDFSGVQGAQNLSYLYGKVSDGVAGLMPLAQCVNSAWDTAGEISYLGIRSDGFMHPGVNESTGELYQPALCWTAPQEMVVDVYCNAILDLAANGGDGAAVSIYLNDTCLKTINLDVEDGVAATEAQVAELKSIEVKEGDKIFFMLDPKTNIACDGTLVYAKISLGTKADVSIPSTGDPVALIAATLAVSFLGLAVLTRKKVF